jgi:endonuclease III
MNAKQRPAKTIKLTVRADEVFKKLKKMYPEARTELRFSSPWELLVATILSAQCTDLRVNDVTSRLFQVYKTPRDYTVGPITKLEQIIRPTGFFRQKAKNLRGAARGLLEKHDGRVPASIEDLTALPGVGRKTANVILGNAFGIPGLPVDTHVSRLARRIGFTCHTDPVKIEADLCELVLRKRWTLFSHLLIFHGRSVCKARKPACDNCQINTHCSYYKEIFLTY